MPKRLKPTRRNNNRHLQDNYALQNQGEGLVPSSKFKMLAASTTCDKDKYRTIDEDKT
jgi:hypothetical protein